MMKATQPNYTIIVNWKDKGFGCARRCSYCNWRNSPHLPHGRQSDEAISTFIRQCKKPFITISGGADPLYRYNQYAPQFLTMAGIIREQGFQLRVITREIATIAKLPGIADYVSISLDTDVLKDIPSYKHLWGGLDIEYSLVMPPLPTHELVQLKPQYVALQRHLGRRLVLRENLDSIFTLDWPALTFTHADIVFVPKALCLDGRYLTTVDSTGRELMLDNQKLMNFLMARNDVMLFGGIVKHLLNPMVHLEFADIDVIAINPQVMDALSSMFGYRFTEVSETGRYPRYFHGKSAKAGKPIQLVLMNTKADAEQFIFNAQYDVDRVGYSQHQYCYDSTLGETTIRHAINTRTATRIPGQRHLKLFHPDRQRIEQRHKAKLLRKQFTLIEQTG